MQRDQKRSHLQSDQERKARVWWQKNYYRNLPYVEMREDIAVAIDMDTILTNETLVSASTTTTSSILSAVLYMSPVPFWGTLMISSAASFFLLLCFICTICCCCRGRKKKPPSDRRVHHDTMDYSMFKTGIQPDCIEHGMQDGLGVLYYTLDYRLEKSDLIVQVVKIYYLPDSQFIGPPNPQVKLYLESSLTETKTESNRKPGERETKTESRRKSSEREAKTVSRQKSSEKETKAESRWKFAITEAIAESRKKSKDVKTREVKETKIQPLTNHPTFNESFLFKMASSEQSSTTVVFEVYDFQLFHKAKMIGQLKVPLAPLMLGELVEGEGKLQPPELQDRDLGQICLSLRYVPAKSKLTVIVIEAKDLYKAVPEYRDPYVKVSLMLNKKRLKKQVTLTKTTSGVNPYYNESFVFDVKPNQLPSARTGKKIEDGDRVKEEDTKEEKDGKQKDEKESSYVYLVVSVAFHDQLRRTFPVGEVIFGSELPGTGHKHWTYMLSHLGQPLAQWHPLQAIKR